MDRCASSCVLDTGQGCPFLSQGYVMKAMWLIPGAPPWTAGEDQWPLGGPSWDTRGLQGYFVSVLSVLCLHSSPGKPCYPVFAKIKLTVVINQSQVFGNRWRNVFKVHRKLDKATKIVLQPWKMGERLQAKDRSEVPRPNVDFSHLIPDLKINSRKWQTELIVSDMLVSTKTIFAYLKSWKERCLTW